MNESEFRIGNLVKYHGRLAIIEAIGKGGFCNLSILNHHVDALEHDLNECQPVEITDELLSNFNVALEDDSNHEGYGKWFLPEIDGWPVSLKKEIDCYSVLVNDEYQIAVVKYVHQLQNLYFALEGKELKRKEL